MTNQRDDGSERQTSPARTERPGCAPAISASSATEGELFVTGRIKDLIIIRGINHYPQDIERTVQSLHDALRENCGAAFSVPDEHRRGDARRRTGGRARRAQPASTLTRSGVDPREASPDQHELSARHIALIRPGTLPKTTSGKIQRKRARQLWLDGAV